MLDGFALGGSISEHSGVNCYPAMRNDSDERFIVKTISIPASQVQVDALLLTGAFPNAEAAGRYFEELADGIRSEVEILDKLAKQRGFLPYHKFQIVPMAEGVGYEVWLLSPYNLTLERYLKRAPMTHLSAVNMGIDLCAAMVVCREAGYLYVDLKPGNIFLPGRQEYRIGDLGFIRLDSLKYASLPDRYRSAYTPPEVADAYSTLNSTMDIYALGLVLYQVYNNGQLPFDSEESRRALMERLSAGEALPAPANADYEMAQIIEKACAYKPEDRWADPAEMGHALISYMQRNGANDVPIVPPVIPEPQEVPEEPEDDTEEVSPVQPEDAPADGEDAAPADADGAEDAPADEDAAEDPEDEDTDTDGVAAPAQDWIDRMGAILAEDGTGDGAGEDGEPQPTLRQLLETDDDDVTDTDVSAGELSDDTAGMLTLAQELIDHAAPAPVVAPEPIDVPIPEPIVLEEENPEEPEDTENPDETPAADGEAPADSPAEDTAPPAPAEEDEPAPIYEDPEPKPGRLKKFLSIVAALLAVAMLGFGAYYYYNEYYLQPIDSMTVQGLDNQLTVTVDTPMDQSLLTVICKDTYGNAQQGKLENGTVTFTDLLPGTQYIVSLEVEGFHELVNAIPATYYTPAETKFINMTTVTGQEDGSAILSFGVEGTDSDEWTVICTAEEEEEKSLTFSGHTVTITGLTVGKTYTFTLEAPEEIYLVGEHSITHTASALITAENLTVSGYAEGSITAVWTAPEGAVVDSWIARCYNEDGYDQILEVTETSATFTDITANAGYTLEVTASGMTMGTRTFVTANPITITGVTAEAVDGKIQLSWTYDGQAPASGWVILYTADNGAGQQVLNTDEASAELTLVAPGSHYDIVIQTSDTTSIFGGTASVDVPDSGAFSGYKLDTNKISVTTHAIPDKENWGSKDLRSADSVTTFSPGGSMALLYHTRNKYSIVQDELVTLFVIRDTEGKLVSISSNTRTWADMWYDGYCVETVKNLPADPGSYTLTVYIDGMKLTIQDFTIE